MKGWRECRLGEHISIKHGYAFKGDFITSEETDNILVTPGNFSIGGGFKAAKYKYYCDEIPSDYVLSKGSIIVTMTDLSKDGDTLGYGAIVPPDKKVYLHNQRIGLVNFITSEVNSKFIYWILRTKDYHEYVLGSATGTSVQHTSPTAISQYEFLLPPLPEQQTIAAVLSILDDKIDLLHRQNKTLEALAQTLFRQWFVEEADEGWEEGRLGDYIETNRKSATTNYPYEDILYLDTGSLTAGNIENIQKMSFADAPSRARRLVTHNDILISTVRPDQKHYGIIQYPEDNLLVSTGFCVITCNDISPFFVYVFLTTKDMTEYLHSIAEGSTSTYPSLKPSDIEDINFLLPPVARLENFDVIARSSWSKIHKNQIQIHALTKLRDSLLPKLMSGEVQVEV